MTQQSSGQDATVQEKTNVLVHTLRCCVVVAAGAGHGGRRVLRHGGAQRARARHRARQAHTGHLPRGGAHARLDPRARQQHAADAAPARRPHLPHQQEFAGAAGRGGDGVQRHRPEGGRRAAAVRDAAERAQRRRRAHRPPAVRRRPAPVRRRALAPPRGARRRARHAAQSAAAADTPHELVGVGRGVPGAAGHQEHLAVRGQRTRRDGGGAASAARRGGAPRGAHARRGRTARRARPVRAAGAPRRGTARPGGQRGVLRAAGHRARRHWWHGAAQGYRQPHQGAEEKGEPHRVLGGGLRGRAASARAHVTAA